MIAIVSVLAFVVLWWVMGAAMFLGTLYVIDRDEAIDFIHDVWRLIRL